MESLFMQGLERCGCGTWGHRLGHVVVLGAWLDTEVSEAFPTVIP